MRRYLLDQSIEVLEVFSDYQQFNAERLSEKFCLVAESDRFNSVGQPPYV